MSDQAVPGKRILTLPADQWNDMAYAARAFRESRLTQTSDGGGMYEPDPTRILVRNDTGALLPRFAIVAIGSPWLSSGLSGSTLDTFKTRVTCAGTAPIEANRGRFAILASACPAGGVVEAVASGVVQCQIQVDDSTEEDYEWADIEPGSTSVLHAATSGSARILWKESGTGTVWAQVRLSNRSVATSAPQCYLHGIRVYRPTDGYVSNRYIKYNRTPGSIYWTDSIGDVAGCNLAINTGSVTAYTDYGIKVTAAGWYEFDWRVSAYDVTNDVDKYHYNATTSSDGAQGSHTHTFTGSNTNTDTAATHTHGLSSIGPYTSDSAGSHSHSMTPLGSLSSDGSFLAHYHTVEVPTSQFGISAFGSIRWRASGGTEGDWDLLAVAAARFKPFPCLDEPYNGSYASLAPRGLLYLAANAELVFRMQVNADGASSSYYDDAAAQVVALASYTNCKVTYHGNGLATASHYP